MARWEVVLTGTEEDLNTVTKLFTESHCRVAKHADGNYYLTSDEFSARTEAADVFSMSKNSLIPDINALMRLRDSAFQAISSGAVTRVDDDGTRSGFVFVPSTISLRAEARLNAEGTVIGSDGQLVPSPEPGIAESRLRLALHDANVASVLRYWCGCDAADPALWVNAYKVFEIIREDVAAGQDVGRGTETMKSLGWATGDEIRNFKESANNVAVSGEKARHAGNEPVKPGTVALNEYEAVAFVRRLIEHWLDWKVARASKSDS